MKIASIAEVRKHFCSYLKSSEEGGPVVVTRNGKPAAVLLSLSDEDEIERLCLAYSPKFQGILQASRKQIRSGKGIPHEQFWNEVEGRKAGRRRKA